MALLAAGALLLALLVPAFSVLAAYHNDRIAPQDPDIATNTVYAFQPASLASGEDSVMSGSPSDMVSDQNGSEASPSGSTGDSANVSAPGSQSAAAGGTGNGQGGYSETASEREFAIGTAERRKKEKKKKSWFRSFVTIEEKDPTAPIEIEEPASDDATADASQNHSPLNAISVFQNKNPKLQPTPTPLPASPSGPSAVYTVPGTEPTQTPGSTPSPTPATEPTAAPSTAPASDPEPTLTPIETVTPSPEPANEPTGTPIPEQTEEPTAVPTLEPTIEPTATPSPEPTEEPTITPTPEPTKEPTVTPAPEPTEEPTVTPAPEPAEEPTITPTPEPTEEPTITPTPAPGHEHKAKPVAEKPATCTETGVKAHYICTEPGCGKLFSDIDCKNEITEESLEIPATGHDWGDWKPVEGEEGKEIRICKNDETHTETRDKEDTPPHEHPLSPVAAKEATETEPGNKAYYICSECGKWFWDAGGKQEIFDHTAVIITLE